jgi:CHAT domain
MGAISRTICVGYRCIVNRVLPTVGELVPKKENHLTDLLEEPRLPAKVFVCRTLAHVGREEWRLRRQLEASVWPRRGVVGTAADLAEFLWHVTHCTRRQERKIPDQIHHFASHFDTTSVDCEEHAIRLAGCANSEFQVALWQLNAKVAELKARGPLPSRNMRPLVFVNACGTSKMDPDGALSLPDLFLGPLLCSRGFIGTETTMSDPVAMEFATWFYERLLHGAPIGRALHDSRRRLVEEFRNPLGLFYTCYAHPELRIGIMRN